MSDDDPGQDSFEDKLRSLARELSRSVERMAQFDMDEIVEAIGVDPERAKDLADSARRWLSGHADSLGDDFPLWGVVSKRDTPASASRRAGPHPLNLPTEEQGLALSALDSGRWTVEPGSNVLVTAAGGPGPGDSMELVGELRARDWLSADGEVTLVGRNALSRWVAGADPQEPQPGH